MATRTGAERRSRRVYRAVADPSRRRILDTLARDGETAALALVGGFRGSQPALSRHLRVLREAGLVRVRRAGRQQLYRLDAEPLREVDAWIEAYRRFWSERLDALGQYLDDTASQPRKEPR